MNRGKYNVLTGQFENEAQAPGRLLGTQSAGTGIGFAQTSDGIVFHAKKQRRRAATRSAIGPFQILPVPNAPDAGPDTTPKIGVAFYSGLYKLDFTKLAISGLLASNSPLDSDEGGFDLPAIGDKIWLQIGTCAADGDAPRPLVETAATTKIQHGPVGGDLWDEYPNPISINIDDPIRPFQEFYNILIAEVTNFETDLRPSILDFTIGSEHRQITQMYSQNIQLALWANNGFVCLIPVDPVLNYEPST